MQHLITAATDLFPYVPLVAGIYLFWTGLRAWIRGSRQTGESGNRLLGMMRGFRVGIIGLALAGVGLWLLTGQTWILVVALGVGGEELLESSFIIATIRADPRLREKAN
jgi:hypothetical protein